MLLERRRHEVATADVDDVVLRLRRLTPREVRLLILAAEGDLTHRELSETLGVTQGNVAATMQRVRRKLAVPRHENLSVFVAGHPTLATELISPRPTAHPGRGQQTKQRELHLLRATIDDLKSVAVRARQRADSLEVALVADETAKAMQVEEVWTMRRVAELTDDAVAEALSIARRPENAAPALEVVRVIA